MTLIDEVRAAQQMPLPRVARAIRMAAGVSQARLARELGVHRLTVVRWERGDFEPRGEVRARYAQLLEGLRQAAAA